MTLGDLRKMGVLSALDVHFAEAISRIGEEVRPEVTLAAALVSRQAAQGDVCLDLSCPPVLLDEAGRPVGDDLWPEPRHWVDAVRSSRLVAPSVGDDGEELAPLVVDPVGRLYLRRFWRHQHELAEALRARARRGVAALDEGVLREGLERLFPIGDSRDPDGWVWQRVAALTAVLRPLTVITGGPGTGKTTTVVRILALLVEQARAADPKARLRIVLLAPTGKAAARLTESIRSARDSLACDASVRESIPDEASTIHRGLGALGGSGARFRHGPENPLAADVVLVDESSMVDLALMNRLVSALPADSHLILLGDRDQLASVEAGSVLGDLCDAERLARPCSTVHARRLHDLGGVTVAGAGEEGLRDGFVELVRSYRYPAESGLGRFATAVRTGDREAAFAVLSDPAFPDVSWSVPAAEGKIDSEFRGLLLEGFRRSVGDEDPEIALARLGAFRVLCAHRRGPFGVEAMNVLVEDLLREEGVLRERGSIYPGRPLLVTRNDYGLGLYNGDVGCIVSDHKDPLGERRLAVFPGPNGPRLLSPTRLPAHETAFAMSIHKSQGTELEEVVVVLPETASPVLSRELLYTAVTRARSRVVVRGSREVILLAMTTPTRRTSGLRDLLWV